MAIKFSADHAHRLAVPVKLQGRHLLEPALGQASEQRLPSSRKAKSSSTLSSGQSKLQPRRTLPFLLNKAGQWCDETFQRNSASLTDLKAWLSS